ncbi:sugar-binding protein, partial [Pseudomonas sp. CAM1A]
MSANTSLHSNAFNFMGYLQGGVDPRTGQYTVAISLLEAKVNALQGPDLPLALFFSPLNPFDSGYGLGWNLQLSQYDTATKVVSAHSGGSFRSTGSEGSRLLMREQKIDDFRLFDEGGGNYRLVHRSGLVERLLKQLGSDLALPVEVYGDKGHLLKLEYVQFRDKDNKIHPRLALIKDRNDKVVLRIDRQTDGLDIHLNPNDSGNAKATYHLQLDTLKRVSRVVLPTTEAASWRYQYEELEKLHVIKEVDTPIGANEVITHSRVAADHHRVPEQAGGGYLPRVLKHVIKPSSGQDDTLTTDYAYALSKGTGYRAGNNFLGANLTHNKPDYGLDYLFSSVGTYAYGSTETRTKQGEEHKVEREY